MSKSQIKTAEFPRPTGAVPGADPASQPSVDVEFGAASHVGRRRSNNEDHYAVVRRTRSRQILLTNIEDRDMALPDDHAYALVVADGIGGQGFGELASELVLRIGWELSGKQSSWPMKFEEALWPEFREHAESFAREIQRALVAYTEAHPRTTDMGSTWTCAYTMGPHAVLAHVGDSRAYLFRDGALQRLTRDHTIAQEMQDMGLPPSDTVGFRHLLTNSFGGNKETVEVDVGHVALRDRDRLLLCSDGLTEMVSDGEIAKTLGTVPGPQAACNALRDLALSHGGKDNVTVVIGEFHISPPTAAASAEHESARHASRDSGNQSGR